MESDADSDDMLLLATTALAPAVRVRRLRGRARCGRRGSGVVGRARNRERGRETQSVPGPFSTRAREGRDAEALWSL